MAKRVAIFTTFYEATSGYSLIGVTESQLKGLLDHNYDPMVLVQENFTQPKDESTVWKPETIDLRKVVPFMHFCNEVHQDFEERVNQVEKALEENLKGIDVCITHDIILQVAYKEHNVAMRRYARKHPEVLWLHWIHSCPSPVQNTTYPENCRYTSPPGYIIYPNGFDKPRVSQTYNLRGQEWKVKVLRHSIDPLEIWPYDKLTRELATKSGLINAEVGIVYPVRLDYGKQPEKIIRIVAALHNLGVDAKLLIIDWQSQGKRFQDYIEKLIILADELGVKDSVNFTSRLDDRCSQGIPRKNVIELMDLSNVYIHPSKIETYSLVAHEAMLRGNLVVLNYDLPVMHELFEENSIYMDFGSDRIDRTYNPTEQAFWNDEAKRLITELKGNRAVMAKTKARREWSPQALWRDFESLFYLQPVGE